MKNPHWLASAIVASFCIAVTSPTWAQARFLEGMVTFSDFRITATAIDPDGPQPGVTAARAAQGFLHSELCYIPAFCQRADAYAAPNNPASTPMPLHTGVAYFGSSSTGDVTPAMTSLFAHVQFLDGTRQNKGESHAGLFLPQFDILPNTMATFSVRLSGSLSAADPQLFEFGRIYAWAQFVQPYPAEPQFNAFELNAGTVAQTFDQTMSLFVRNDTDVVQNAWLDLRSGFELQLLVPEPSSWLMLLAGLGLLAASARRQAVTAIWPGSAA